LGLEVSLVEDFVNTSQSIGIFGRIDMRYDTEGVVVNGWESRVMGPSPSFSSPF